MSGNYSAKVGNKGRLVIPAGLREAKGWTVDTVLVFLEKGDEVEVVSQADLLKRIRANFAGTNVVEELIAERREAARKEDEEIELERARLQVGRA